VPSAGAGSDELPIDRWLALETANAGKVIEITSEQAAFLEKLNPCFRERHVESSSPGELLSADTFFVGSLKGVGKVYLHAVIDTFGSYAFGFLHVSRQPEAAVAVLHNDVLPFYRNLDLPIGAILTGNGREFCGTGRHPYELYLELGGISATETWAEDPSKPSCHSSAKKVKWTHWAVAPARLTRRRPCRSGPLGRRCPPRAGSPLPDTKCTILAHSRWKRVKTIHPCNERTRRSPSNRSRIASAAARAPAAVV